MTAMDGASNESVQAEIALAQEAYRAGNLALADARINKLTEKYPDRADVLMAKGMILYARNEQAGALDFFAATLAVDPNALETLAWAAYVALNLRRFSEAEGYARRLTQLAPGNGRGHYLLANALRAQDRIPEGLAAIDRALELQPNDPDSLVAKARLLQAWQMSALATECLRRSMAIRPTPAAGMEIARLLSRDGFHESAIEVLREIEPGLPVADRPYGVIAQAYTLLHRFDEAEEQWARAEKYAANSAPVLLNRSRAEISAGRFGVAEEILRDLIEKDREAPSAFAALTLARKMASDDVALVERMAERYEKAGALDDAEKMAVSYALGKSYDDLRDFASAIRWFDEANSLSLRQHEKTRPFHPEQAREFTDFLIELSSPDRIRAAASKGNDSNLPLFVVGMMRSGTTLTESILSAHPRVKGAGEQAFWTERTIDFIEPGPSGLRYDAELVRWLAGEYLKLIDPKDDEILHVVDKNPGNFDLAGILHGSYPRSKILHLKRHAVDNLLSIWMTPISGNVRYASSRENLVFVYREHLRLWKHWREVLPADRFTTVSYEDLTSRPEETIRSMLGFVELDPADACFSPEKNVRSVLTPSVYQVRQPINPSSQERWRNYESWLGVFAELFEEAP